MASIESLIRQVKQLQEDLKEVKDDIPKIKKEVAKEIAAQLYHDLDYIFVTCIDKFYADYDPVFYRREGSLYSTYKLTNKNGVISWNFGAQYMPKAYKHSHRVSNQYIYDQMFLKGYHGGAHTIAEDKIDEWGEHPKDGTPWYRTPPPIKKGIPSYTDWSDRNGAEKSEMSPAQNIREELLAYQDEKSTLLGRGVSDVSESAWDLILSRYNLFNNY